MTALIFFANGHICYYAFKYAQLDMSTIIATSKYFFNFFKFEINVNHNNTNVITYMKHLNLISISEMQKNLIINDLNQKCDYDAYEY